MGEDCANDLQVERDDTLWAAAGSGLGGVKTVGLLS